MPRTVTGVLSAAQLEVAAALASGASISKAARTCQVGRTTIYTWINTIPQFVSAVRSAVIEAAACLRDKIHDTSMDAISAVGALRNDPSAPATARLHAALSILNRQKSWDLSHPIEAPKCTIEPENGTVRNTSEQKTEKSAPVPETLFNPGRIGSKIAESLLAMLPLGPLQVAHAPPGNTG